MKQDRKKNNNLGPRFKVTVPQIDRSALDEDFNIR